MRQYGTEPADDLIDMGILYRRFAYYSGDPWLVCNAAIEEAGLCKGSSGKSVRQLIDFFIGHQSDWSKDAYPGIAQGLLLASGRTRVSRTGVKSVEEVHAVDRPLSFLPDRGDRLVASHALLSNIPVVLTSDRRTFWALRDRFLDLGLQVMRPGELLDLHEPYWALLEAQSARRAPNPSTDHRP